MKRFLAGHPILTFLVITFALSSVFYFLIIHTGKLGSGFGLYHAGLMWCPGISALLTCRILNRKISTLGWSWGKTKYQLKAWLVPALYGFIAYLIIWAFGWGGFYDKDFVRQAAGSFGWDPLPDWLVIPLFVIVRGIFGMVGVAAKALGEEIGWRGFLVPEMSRHMNFTQTSLVIGLIWAVWHFPVLLFADYNSGTPAWYALSCFTVMVISVSLIFSWFRVKSNSLWTAVILHASHNLFIQSIFSPLTRDTGITKYFGGEFGLIVPLVALCFAIYFWSRRAELHAPPLKPLAAGEG